MQKYKACLPDEGNVMYTCTKRIVTLSISRLLTSPVCEWFVAGLLLPATLAVGANVSQQTGEILMLNLKEETNKSYQMRLE